MIHPATRVFGTFGYGPVSLSLHLAAPSSWSGLVYYVFSEQSSFPLICTPSTEFMVRSPKGLPLWTQVKDLERGMYIGTPMSNIRAIADSDSSDVYRRQAWSFVIGHPRSIRGNTLDDESATGDVLFDQKRIWFKVHDIDTSNEPTMLMYRVLDRPILAQNLVCRDASSARDTGV
jgi:hypothetical protein